MDVTFFLWTSVSAAALGVMLGRYVWPTVRGSDRDAVAKAQIEVARLAQESTTLRQNAQQLEADNKAVTGEAKIAQEEVARLTERVNSLVEKTEKQASEYSSLEVQLNSAADEAKAAQIEIAHLKEREKALNQRVELQTSQLAEQQKQLTAEFENIANRILKANAIELSDTSQRNLAAILDPLRERIHAFQQKLETTYDAESRDIVSLKEQIKHIVETSHAIGNQADGLAKALRGDSQQLGRWGELALERILEAAGLREGREYVSQGRGLGLKNETGGAQRPDIIVMLPEGRSMIVDSKVPLTSYDRSLAARNESEAGTFAEQFVRDVKTHIDSLCSKRYQENEKLQAHDCVLMFVPIEGGLAVALRKEPELFAYGWDRHVVLVGPTTLLMTMKTVASIWRYELQGQNAQVIANLAGDLCDKLSASLTDLNHVGEKLAAASSAHNEAVKRLSTGKGNALSLGERIRSLGVQTKKPMPSVLVNGIAVTADEVPEENPSSENETER